MHHMKVGVLKPEELANKMEENSGSLIIVDCRSDIEYSTFHVCGAVNIGGSRSSRREIMSGRVTVLSALYDQIGRTCIKGHLIVVYDQCSVESSSLQSLAGRVAEDLSISFPRVCFLRGGFIGFQSRFSELCWTSKHKMPDEDFVAPSQSVTSGLEHQSATKESHLVEGGGSSLTRSQTMITLSSNQSRQNPALTSSGLRLPSPLSQLPSMCTRHSLSGPALPPSKEGPTTVLPYLLLGTQQDALSQASILKHGITHVVNVSTDGPMCPFVSPHNFLRIPVLDNFADKITPHFPRAFSFLDDVKTTGGRALVHCSAGISRSPTLAIGYLMKTLNISVTEAYNIVKSSRVSVAPNFNFMGQLTDYEKLLKSVADERVAAAINTSASTRQKRRPSRLGFFSTLLKPRTSTSPPRDASTLSTTKLSTSLLPSPSVPFARLGINSPMEDSPGIRLENFPATSLDQLHFQPCQTGPRGIKVKRSATQVDGDSSQIRKRLSIMESCTVDVVTTKSSSNEKSILQDCSPRASEISSRRHSSVLPISTECSADAPSNLPKCECSMEKSECLPSRSVSYERINCLESGWNNSSIMTDSCRLQECHHSTSSLSSANSHSSNLLV